MRWSLVTVVGCLIALGLSGCRAEPRAEQQRPTKISLEPESPPPGSGRFYVEAGATSLAADLYEMRFSPLDFRRLTTDARVTTIGGCSQAVIVAAAQKEVGYADRLQVFRDGKLQPIDGLGRPPASDPDVGPDCRILYYQQTGQEPALVGEIRLWDPAKGMTTTLESGHPDVLAGATWGPDGAVAVLRREPTGAKVTVIRADGSRQVVDPQMPNAGNTQWGETGWLALGDLPPGGGEAGTVFVNPATGARSALPGWVPLVWSPDGTHFLVAGAKDHTRLGVVEVADLTSVREVGRSTVGPIWDAIWLSS